ncbi:MAG: PQQ-dependent sugar dehydrogenase [Dehalococcoidia bacterium]
MRVTLLVILILAAGCGPPPASGRPVAGSSPTSPPPTAASQTTSPAGRTPTTTPAARGFDPSAVRLALTPVLSGLDQVTDFEEAPDGTGRFFVLERAGLVRLFRNGDVAQQPVLDLRSILTSNGQEQGLLGIAFHPAFAQNRRFFVYYTARNGANTVAEYRMSSDPARADPASGRILLAIDDFAQNHNGGNLVFGPDGFLYIGTGDGGGGGDPQRTAQNLGSLLGKLLRIDVDGGEPYRIPPGNPLVGRSGARPEIWAYGLRNPWRFSFDRQTGDLWIADVGQNALEEINFTPAGTPAPVNYGWSTMEASQCFRGQGCDQAGLTLPITEYGRDQGCSVTGGYVYRGKASPALTGAYLFGDYCTGRIWATVPSGQGGWTTTELLRDPSLRISSFAEDRSGELYVVGLGGQVFRLISR